MAGHTGHTLTDAARLLPTPRASDTGTPGRRTGAGFRPPLSQVLLPTPRATDGQKGCPGQRGSHGDLTLPSAAVQIGDTTASTGDTVGRGTPSGAALGVPDEGRWGGYAAAVAHWELLLGRHVPQATQPGQHGRPVLAPAFVEWLMGLGEEWVTGLPLPRTAALRVLGNGVVPQQAHTRCSYRYALTGGRST